MNKHHIKHLARHIAAGLIENARAQGTEILQELYSCSEEEAQQIDQELGKIAQSLEKQSKGNG